MHSLGMATPEGREDWTLRNIMDESCLTTLGLPECPALLCSRRQSRDSEDWVAGTKHLIGTQKVTIGQSEFGDGWLLPPGENQTKSSSFSFICFQFWRKQTNKTKANSRPLHHPSEAWHRHRTLHLSALHTLWSPTPHKQQSGLHHWVASTESGGELRNPFWMQ